MAEAPHRKASRRVWWKRQLDHVGGHHRQGQKKVDPQPHQCRPPAGDPSHQPVQEPGRAQKEQHTQQPGHHRGHGACQLKHQRGEIGDDLQLQLGVVFRHPVIVQLGVEQIHTVLDIVDRDAVRVRLTPRLILVPGDAVQLGQLDGQKQGQKGRQNQGLPQGAPVRLGRVGGFVHVVLLRGTPPAEACPRRAAARVFGRSQAAGSTPYNRSIPNWGQHCHKKPGISFFSRKNTKK